MKHEGIRMLLRERGMCGQVLEPGPKDVFHQACICPIGHDEGEHETGEQDAMPSEPSTAASSAITNADAIAAREEGSDLICRAFQLIVAAEQGARDSTDDELEEILFCLTMGSVKFKKLPGGTEAAERVYTRSKAELARRGKPWVESDLQAVDEQDEIAASKHRILLRTRDGVLASIACSCGYKGTAGRDAEDAMVEHLALVKLALGASLPSGGSTTPPPPPGDDLVLAPTTLELIVDPGRADFRATGIPVRAKLEGRWDSHDIVELSVDSLRAWLRSRGGTNEWAEDVVCILLGHPQP